MNHLVCGILCVTLWVRSVSTSALGSAEGPYPLYMMHLYRTLLASDGKKIAGSSSAGLGHDQPSLHHSDSVLSLVAKSKCLIYIYSSFRIEKVTFDQRCMRRETEWKTQR